MPFPAWPDLPADALEEQLLARWREERLFARSLERTRAGRPFVFFEGPPTANGRPGIHHVASRTIKDLICRFRALQGRRVTRIAGWDTHGLPVEIEVEKELGLDGKKAIEAFGVAEFNARARASVFRYRSEWEELSNRIGYWLDYEHPYVTCSNDYIESVWWLLKRLHEKGLLQPGHRVLPYCPRCGTALSSHELALGYEEVRDRSVYLTFPLDDGSGRELVVWTTTPWTLPANVAAAVHPELEYGEYAFEGGRVLVCAVARAGAIVLEEKGPQGKAVSIADLPRRAVRRGAEYAGLRYRRPLDVVALPAEGASQVVVAESFVTAEDGSGVVHLAPAFGADDQAAALRHGLASVRPVAADGTFEGTRWPEIEGRRVTDDETNEAIVRRLKRDGRWLRTEAYVHSYPHCWRCRSKLIYYARDSWFVRTSLLRERMLELNREVGWHPPEVGAGRFGEWLKSNVDWALSRDRYWGTPLPVWVSDRDPSCVEVIGSYAELAEKVGRPLPEDFDPHKPHVDQYTWAAPGGGTMRRRPEVIDTWFDSGAMPYAQWHHPFENEKEFAAHFPADFICEGVDQTRGWFYSLLAIGTSVFDRLPYRNVIVNEMILDAEGRKMSKSRGNVVDPWQVVREFGADAVRLYLVSTSQVWLPKRFDSRAIPEAVGGFLNTLQQTYRFFALYAGEPSAAPAAGGERTVLDRWLLARLDAAVEEVSAAFEGYDVTAGVRAVFSLVDDLSNWWVRLSRARFWTPDREADPAAVATLHEALLVTARLLAPAAPFVSDWLHRALAGDRSVHLADFPASGGRRDPGLEGAMDGVRRLASLARAAREAASLRVRQPLARLRVAVPAGLRGEVLDSLLPLLATEVNVREAEVVSDRDLVRLRGKPNFRSLGKRFGKETPQVAARVKELPDEALRSLEAGAAVALDGYGTILPEDVTVEREVAGDWLVQSDGPFVAAVDPTLDDELRREGLARELVSRVQRMRKEAGYAYTDRIELYVDGAEATREAALAHADSLREETLARSLAIGERCDAPDLEQRHDLDGHEAILALRRHVAT
jgi:isoleucyl-tRNA synthetase